MKRSAMAGFTLIEIMIVVAIIALLAAVAIPNVLRGRTSANESAAIGNVRALVSSNEMFRSVNNQYADTWLADMYGADCLPATAPAPDYGPNPFCLNIGAGAVVQGYTYTFVPTQGDGATACTGAVGSECSRYTILATPQAVGRTGTRSFFADDTGSIRHCLEPGGAPVADAVNMAGNNTLDQPPTDPCV